MGSLSLCLIVKDEEKHLPECLSTVGDFVDEIIVLDTGSSDSTIAIAKDHGAKVFEAPWENDFSQARNACIAHATSDWILMLDADEWMSAMDLQRVKTLISRHAGKTVGFQLIQRNYTDNTRINGWHALTHAPEAKGAKGYFDSNLTRLFPRDSRIHFMFKIHEDVSPSILALESGRVEKTSIVIHHYGHMKDEVFMETKREMYFDICRMNVAENPGDPKAHFELARMYRERGDMPEAEKHFLQAIERKGDFSRAHAALGEVYMKTQRYKEAKECLGVALQQGLQSDMIYSNLGVVEAKLGNEQQALNALYEGLKVNPKSARIYHNLGSVLLSQQRYGDALDLFETAQKLTGMVKFAALHQEITQKVQGLLSKMEEEQQRKPSLVQVTKMAEIYLKLNRTEDAMRVMEEALFSTEEKSPIVVNLYANLAQLYRSRDKKRAAALLRKVISWQPPGVEFLEGQLKEIEGE